MSSSLSGFRVSNKDRDSSGEMTEKLGFSVVAAISVHQPVLHRWQQDVLLGLGEAMHLVDEQHRFPRRTQVPASLVKDGPDLLYAGGDGGELHEPRIALVGDDRSDRGLADTWRPPEKDRHWLARGEAAEWRSGRHQMVLPQDLLQGARSHPYRQRQAGTVGVPQAATGCDCLTDDGAAEEILAHRLRSYGHRPNDE